MGVFLDSETQQPTIKRSQKKQPPSKTAADGSSTAAAASGNNLVVLFSEKGRCHFCRLLCPDVTTLRSHLESVHQPPRHALCENCENFFHVCAIQRHRQKCTETYQSEKR